MSFYKLYSYDNNKDLIEAICKNFNIKSPTTRINSYGDEDICFNVNLNNYLVQLSDNCMVLKKEDIRRKGQKHRKYYYPVIKKFYDGNIWWNLIKHIKEDSEI